MAQGQRTNRVLVPEARAALDNMKWEIAREVGAGAVHHRAGPANS